MLTDTEKPINTPVISRKTELASEWFPQMEKGLQPVSKFDRITIIGAVLPIFLQQNSSFFLSGS